MEFLDWTTRNKEKKENMNILKVVALLTFNVSYKHMQENLPLSYKQWWLSIIVLLFFFLASFCHYLFCSQCGLLFVIRFAVGVFYKMPRGRYESWLHYSLDGKAKEGVLLQRLAKAGACTILYNVLNLQFFLTFSQDIMRNACLLNQSNHNKDSDDSDYEYELVVVACVLWYYYSFMD